MANIELYPKQQEAVRQTAYEIGFGGARGPGKTFAGICWLLYDVHNPRLRALVIRRNAEDLKDWVDRATQVYCVYNNATKVGNPAEFHFPSGAVIRTGHLKDGNAYMKYQGHEYQRMLIEELTQIAREDDYMRLLASCRSTVEGLPAQIFSTFNPGGPGHDWVKKRFVVPAEAGTVFYDPVSKRSRVFISANVYDNPHIMDHDPEYVQYLESLSPTLKKQWLEGSWEDFEVDGAIFGAEMVQVKQQGRITSVPYDPLLPVETWWDLGRNDHNVVWFVQKVGREVRVIDYYTVQFSNLRSILYELKTREDVRGYKYGMFVFPHDINVHEYTEGRSRMESCKVFVREIWDRDMKEGIDYKIVPAFKKDNTDGIDAARVLLQYCWFDEVKCADGVYNLKNYHRSRIDGTDIYSNTPAHDEHSHAATAFMYGSLVTENFVKQRQDFEKKEIKKRLNTMLPERDAVPNYLTGEPVSRGRGGNQYQPNYLTGE